MLRELASLVGSEVTFLSCDDKAKASKEKPSFPPIQNRLCKLAFYPGASRAATASFGLPLPEQSDQGFAWYEMLKGLFWHFNSAGYESEVVEEEPDQGGDRGGREEEGDEKSG